MTARRLQCCLACIGLGLSAVLCPPARAQEDDDGKAERVSRATRETSLDAGYELAAFLGRYTQGRDQGLLFNARTRLSQQRARDRFRFELDYEYDAFSSKTFNFADEDQDTSPARLVQPVHEASFLPGWSRRWSRWVRTRVTAEASLSYPAFRRDRRWASSLEPRLRWGKLTGAYAELSAELFYKKYPYYQVADRRIDQEGAGLQLEGGYEFRSGVAVAGGVEGKLNQYLDSRYDAVTSDGQVVRATTSKQYRIGMAFAGIEGRVGDTLRLSLRYQYESNDALNYDRTVTGSSLQGFELVKFIPDYYDFVRHRIDYKSRVTAGERWTLKHVGSFWVRDFATYEARDRDNVWTGALRHDTSIEYGLEVSWKWLEFRRLASDHGLFLTGFGSHLQRRSNMEREVALATNFALSRVFIGVELREQ